MDFLKRGSSGEAVKELQGLLTARGYPVEITGTFATRTEQAVRAFQSQNLDPRGHPLVVDGKVGDLTWWSLRNPKPRAPVDGLVDYSQLPPAAAGGSARGRAALAAAIGELNAKAREIGGDNRGEFVRKYLQGAGLPEGNPWCASFVSWCLLQAVGGQRSKMPIAYNASARGLLKEAKDAGLAQAPQSGYQPKPGDLVVWWRGELSGWLGHVGFVHQLRDGVLYTIEGNRSPQVQGFSYVLSRMDKLLGYVSY